MTGPLTRHIFPRPRRQAQVWCGRCLDFVRADKFPAHIKRDLEVGKGIRIYNGTLRPWRALIASKRESESERERYNVRADKAQARVQEGEGGRRESAGDPPSPVVGGS